jgi:hypothetical protein
MQVSFRDSSPIRPGDEALVVIPDFFDGSMTLGRGMSARSGCNLASTVEETGARNQHLAMLA